MARDVTWAMAVLGSTSSPKKSRTTLTPTSDFASCRTMPLAWPVQRSRRVVRSLSMISAGMPGYRVRTWTAGVLKIGRMSAGRRKRAVVPTMRMARARTATAWGWHRAALTTIAIPRRRGPVGFVEQVQQFLGGHLPHEDEASAPDAARAHVVAAGLAAARLPQVAAGDEERELLALRVVEEELDQPSVDLAQPPAQEPRRREEGSDGGERDSSGEEGDHLPRVVRRHLGRH